LSQKAEKSVTFLFPLYSYRIVGKRKEIDDKILSFFLLFQWKCKDGKGFTVFFSITRFFSLLNYEHIVTYPS